VLRPPFVDDEEEAAEESGVLLDDDEKEDEMEPQWLLPTELRLWCAKEVTFRGMGRPVGDDNAVTRAGVSQWSLTRSVVEEQVVVVVDEVARSVSMAEEAVFLGCCNSQGWERRSCRQGRWSA